MKKSLWLAVAAGAVLFASAPAPAEASSETPGVVQASRRSHRRHHGGRRIFVRPSFYWGWGAGWWGHPYGYYGYGHPYYGYYRRPYGYRPSPDWAALDTDVSPEGAHVYLDGTYVGTADDFDGYPDFLYLKRGRYRVEFRLPGYESRTLDIQARPGMKLRIDERLRKIPGSKQYGSYDEPARPEGDVRRFWAKRRDVAESVDDDDEIYGARPDRDARYDDDDEEEDLDDADEDADREREEDRQEADRSRDRREDTWRESRPESRREAARDSARLRVRVEPADAVVFLDDRFVGTATEIGSLSRGISLAPGKHTVTVSRPGYRDRTVEVDVDEGETEEIEIKLSR